MIEMERTKKMRWTRDEKSYTFKRWREKASLQEISVEVNRPILGVISQIHRNKHWRHTCPDWTPKELKLLKRIYPLENYPLKRLEKIFHRSKFAICMKAGQMGLHKRNYKDWTANERAYLITHYGSFPMSEMVDYLKKPIAKIYSQANNLGLQRIH